MWLKTFCQPQTQRIRCITAVHKNALDSTLTTDLVIINFASKWLFSLLYKLFVPSFYEWVEHIKVFIKTASKIKFPKQRSYDLAHTLRINIVTQRHLIHRKDVVVLF